MGLVSSIVVFLMIWWAALFVILPFGVARKHGAGPEDGIAGAPDNPQLRKKFIITTLLSFVLWGIVYMLIEVEIISFRELAKDM